MTKILYGIIHSDGGLEETSVGFVIGTGVLGETRDAGIMQPLLLQKRSSARAICKDIIYKQKRDSYRRETNPQPVKIELKYDLPATSIPN